MVRDVVVGGGAPVVVQAMTKVDPHDARAVARQADELYDLGARIVRVAVPDRRAAEALAEVVRRARAPIVADIHFAPGLALAAIAAGVHKVRVNPGNLRGGEDAVRAVARAASARGVPIRVGANSGSLPKGDLPADRGRALAEAVIAECRAFERVGFTDIVVSAKGNDVASTVAAGRALAHETDYPLHVGLTAAGPPSCARVKSAIGIGSLLADGIGDTIRVSYTGPPHEEVRAAYEILEAVGLERSGPEIVSCPTCGRCGTDLAATVESVREALAGLTAPITVAVMGCEVNGPGEAAGADVGLACFGGGGYLFAGGEKIRRVREDAMVAALVELATKVAAEAELGRVEHAPALSRKDAP